MYGERKSSTLGLRSLRARCCWQTCKRCEPVKNRGMYPKPEAIHHPASTGTTEKVTLHWSHSYECYVKSQLCPAVHGVIHTATHASAGVLHGHLHTPNKVSTTELPNRILYDVKCRKFHELLQNARRETTKNTTEWLRGCGSVVEHSPNTCEGLGSIQNCHGKYLNRSIISTVWQLIKKLFLFLI